MFAVDSGLKVADIPAMTMTSTTAGWSARLLSILRIVSGLLFVEHGTQKVLGFPPGPGPHPGFNLSSMVGVSGALELIGGTLLIIGFFTRITAFILSGEMAVAYFGVHLGLFMGHAQSFYPIVNKGEIAVLYCFVFLYLAAAGGGPWSVDHMRRRG
jgi:putative oxidoreductase